MAEIPTYSRQIAPPDTVRGVNPALSGASPIAHGLADVSRGLSIAANDFERQVAVRKQAEDKQADERARAWAGEQAGMTMLAQMRALDEQQRKAPPGADGFAKAFLEGFDKHTGDALAAAPDEKSKRYLGAHFQAQRNQLGAHALDFQFKSGDADATNRFQNGVETWGKVVDQDPSQFNAAMRTVNDTMPDVVSSKRPALVEHARQMLTTAAAASTMNQAPDIDAQRGGPYDVRKWTDMALGGDGKGAEIGPDGQPVYRKTGVPWIDQATPAQVRTWNDTARVRIHQIEQQRNREDEAREKVAERTFTAAADMSMKGQYLDPETTSNLINRTRGTSHEEAALKLLDDQKNVAGFAAAPASERTAVLEALRMPGADPSRGTNPEASKRLAKMEAIHDAINTAAGKNVWGAATKYGVLKSAPLQEVRTVEDALKIVDGRAPQQDSVESWSGKAESPFQPEEASQFASILEKLPPKQASSALGELGAKIGSSERVGAFARQIKDKDGTLFLAMGYQGTQTSEGRYASELILEGQQKIKDKAVVPDRTKELSWRKQIAEQVRDAYANKALADQVVEAAFLIAAAKDGDIDNAVRLATGGGVIDFNGAKVPMPVGYQTDGGQSGAEAKFRKAIAAIPPEQLMPQAIDGKVYAQGVPMPASEFLQKLPTAQLVHAGQGRYNVKAGTSVVTNAEGKRIEIRLDGPYK